MKIKVNQFDNTGKLIACYDSYSTAAENLGCNESTVRKAARDNKLVYGKFYFEDAEIRGAETNIDGMYEFGEPSNLGNQPEVIELTSNKPKILFLDIETAPLRSYTWGLWKQNVGLSQIISNWYMISWAAKWLGDDEVFSDVLQSHEAIAEDDKRIVGNLWEVLDEADIIIAHNGDAFDIPKINTRFVLHGFDPPSPYRTIDTLTIARQRFGFTSNRLDFLAKFFGYEGKAPTKFELWENCMIGDEDALYYMDFYCKQDIITLEQVFMKLRPFAKGLPNLDLYQDNATSVCPVCGEGHLTTLPDKFFYTQSVKYQVYRCTKCGGLARAKKGIKFENAKQISAIPR